MGDSKTATVISESEWAWDREGEESRVSETTGSQRICWVIWTGTREQEHRWLQSLVRLY